MQIQPYIFFYGNCEEALNFYHTALGGEIIQLMRVSEAPENAQCPMTDPDKILHAAIRLGSSILMMSDGLSAPPPPVATYSLSLIAPTVTQGETWFRQLSEGGDVTMPFGKTFWSPGFGMLADKFGIRWMVNTEA
ncbi:VOC family protein [Enterobacillus tribolii]|uniref:PhnB protein n=1 Tax=Enterobacillus tribolii TaxID=1487935 RepID=A0A370QNR7_9GAMM|nr:VOC family protein [Enterobacillus tribolii]MBW7982032.1 VOC family protein [Enterobacillus tribolii]RDK89948.1 PhnB protein [Enterobacillus tribolii]